MAETGETHRFEVNIVWSGDGHGSGESRVAEGSFGIPFAGAKGLGGAGGKANPEELLLAAVGSCFVDTWAIFLKKLGIAYAEPTLRVSAEVGKDPAGGYRVQEIRVHARVPSVLLASDRARIEKTLSLAEKYCIVSKAVRASAPIAVEIEEV